MDKKYYEKHYHTSRATPLQLDLAASPSSLITQFTHKKTAKLMVLINIFVYLLWVKPTMQVVGMDTS